MVLPSLQALATPPCVVPVRRCPDSMAAQAARLPPEGLPARQPQAALPQAQAATPVQPACIDLTLSDSDDERWPCGPPMPGQSSPTVHADSAASCQALLPIASQAGILDAAARLGLARALQQPATAPVRGCSEAVKRLLASAAAPTECLADADGGELPSAPPRKRHCALGGKGDRLAAAVRDSISSGADMDDFGVAHPSSRSMASELPELRLPSLVPQLRCSRRVQKRALELLSVRNSLIVAYPIGGDADQSYIESLDMTADLATALRIGTAEAEHSGYVSVANRRNRSARLHCGLMQRAAVAIRTASDMSVRQLLLSRGDHEAALIRGIRDAVRSPTPDDAFLR